MPLNMAIMGRIRHLLATLLAVALILMPTSVVSAVVPPHL